MLDLFISFGALTVSLIALGRAFFDHRRYKNEAATLEKRVHEVQRILTHRGNLANEIAHEIKNPITAILCSAETLDLLLSDKLDETNRKSLQYIREYGDNLLRLVSDFLDVSRAESGTISARPQSLAVSPVIESIVGLLQPSAARKDITITAHTQDKNIRAKVDQIHFKQIIFNLLHNAIKFTNRGGQIKVDVCCPPESQVVYVAIQDNGSGIPLQHLDSLFDPYTRYENHGSGVFPGVGPGVGLGLSLCKSLVNLAGGKIAVRSELNVGTIFEFTLPLCDQYFEMAQIPQLLSSAQQISKPLVGQHFLVMHSDNGTGDAVSQLIEAWGGVVDQVNEATAAMNALSAKDYDAVLVDESIGPEVSENIVKRLDSEESVKKTTLILTGLNAEELKSYSQTNSKTRFIEKPFNGKVLLQSLLSSGKYEVTH